MIQPIVRPVDRHSSVPSSVLHEACIASQHASAHIHPPISHQSILAMSASIWPGAVVEGYLHMHAGRCCRAGCCEVLLQKRQGDVARLLIARGKRDRAHSKALTSHLPTTFPSLSTRNLEKFHLMSLLRIPALGEGAGGGVRGGVTLP